MCASAAGELTAKAESRLRGGMLDSLRRGLGLVPSKYEDAAQLLARTASQLQRAKHCEPPIAPRPCSRVLPPSELAPPAAAAAQTECAAGPTPTDRERKAGTP